MSGHTQRFNEVHRDLEPGESLFSVKDVKRRDRILGGWGKEDRGVGVWERGVGEEKGKGGRGGRGGKGEGEGGEGWVERGSYVRVLVEGCYDGEIDCWV